MEHFEDVKNFYDYLIIDDDGWKGIRDDAPDEVKQAFQNYLKEENGNTRNNLKV